MPRLLTVETFKWDGGLIDLGRRLFGAKWNPEYATTGELQDLIDEYNALACEFAGQDQYDDLDDETEARILGIYDEA